MSSESPESCSACNDFEENTVGRMGYSRINSNRVSKVFHLSMKLEALEALREKTRIWKRRKSETHAYKIPTGR